YYADENYQLATGWVTVNNKHYYFEEDAAMHQEGWLEVAGDTYYIQEDGSAATGLLLLENNWNQFNADGKLLKSWASRAAVTAEPETTPETTATTATTTAATQTTTVTTTVPVEVVTEAVTEVVTEPETEPETTIPAGWLEKSGKKYYINENGEKTTGWLNLDGQIYYLDDIGGEALSGWQYLTSSPDGTGNYYYYYFSPEDFTMQTGWLTLPEGKYYLDDDGTRHVGVLDYQENTYKFDENGLLITNQTTNEGTYDENGVFTKKVKTEYNIPSSVASQELIDIINNADRTPGIRHIDVKNRQYGLPYTTDPDLKKGINLTDRDYEIIEQFAAEHFTDDMTIAECLYETWWWIHCNVQYAYAGSLWNMIDDKSYPDAIFNYKTGQCVQYNGAMAAMLAYYGYDVYMVKGWVNRSTQSGQHYWTEVMIDGTRYYVETGNRGKNGDHWQYFFVNAEDVDYTATY
ncbi:MAG: hypothetical protein IKI37_03270, partial [Oscillospiraceae bacterium]|nr:hypothetical protein [Oscillospiraceae bacterium]